MITYDLQMQKEMPTVSSEDPTFDHDGVLDGKPPALLPALVYVEVQDG